LNRRVTPPTVNWTEGEPQIKKGLY
jgi:hypothetical protein